MCAAGARDYRRAACFRGRYGLSRSSGISDQPPQGRSATDGAASMRRFSLVVMLSILLAGERAVAQTPAPAANVPAAQPVPSGTTSALTLQQAEAIALRNNPQITIGKLRSFVAQQFVREQRSALLPNAYLSLTAVDSNPGTRIAAGFISNPIVLPRAAGGVTVGQLLTDFGRTANLLSSSHYAAKAEYANAAATRLQIILAVDKPV